MSGLSDKPGVSDPRRQMDPESLDAASVNALPSVAKTSGLGDSLGLAAGVLGACLLGGFTLLTLSNNRAATPPPAPVTQAPPAETPPPPPTTMDVPFVPLSEIPVPQPMPPQPMPQPATPNQAEFAAAGLKANALIIDNSAPPPPAAKDPAAAGAATNSPMLSGNDQFWASQTGGQGADRAVRIRNPSQVVPQGAIIPAVLETALNSDLPGYVRALVTRDVRSFDGKTVLIPRGSRLVGQYKSGLSSGVTRAFVIWNRIIRPDGVAVQLGSPATDELGAAGLSGKVDTHFAKRFGSAVLLSIVNGLASSLGNNSSNTIVIGSASEAGSAATSALEADANIPPTIKVAQGTAVQVFVARDLDFSAGVN